MTKSINHTAATVFFIAAAMIAGAGTILGQTAPKADASAGANAANPQTVDARQSGTWTVGIDPIRNTVQLSNTATDPLPVKVIKSGPARTPFQKRAIVTPLGTGFETVFLPIPAGKRLIIENVSVIVRCPVGMRMETNYFTYFDNGDGQGGISAITFHRVPLVDQGVIAGTQIFTANDRTLVFADEQIGGQHYQIGVQARLNAAPPGGNVTLQAQFTFSGYLEDLPIEP